MGVCRVFTVPSLSSQAAHPHTPMARTHTHTLTASSNMSINAGLHNPISCASCAKPSEVWHTEKVHRDQSPLSLACRSRMETEFSDKELQICLCPLCFCDSSFSPHTLGNYDIMMYFNPEISFSPK